MSEVPRLSSAGGEGAPAAGREAIRNSLYSAYASTHAGVKSTSGEALSFRHGILPHMPPARTARVIDVGCGQGELIRQLLAHGYVNATGIDISDEQVQLAHRNGVYQVEQGDVFSRLISAPGSVDCIIATDLLEHLSKPEVVRLIDSIGTALRPGGVFIARMPNAISPFAGNYQHGDFTHETSFTPRSFRQVVTNCGFSRVSAFSCPPVPHGVVSAVRAVIWHAASGVMRLALAAETGELKGHIVTQNFVGVARR